MGTSKSMSTPKGGKWTKVKTGINTCLSGGGSSAAQQIISSTIAASGGFFSRSSSGGSSGGGGGMGGRGGRVVGKTVSGLAGFGTALASRGLDQALRSLGIEDLNGKSAGEVISRIAEHLSNDIDGLEQAIIRDAIQQAILNASELVGDTTYENLEESLQTFLSRQGIEGLIENFLTQYVFDKVWLLIEDHVNKRTDDQANISSLEVAVEQSCRSNVHDAIEHHKQEGTFYNLDWFGKDGLRVAETIVSTLDQRLQTTRGDIG